MKDLRLPPQEEGQGHYLSCHTLYRSWCHHCVRGRGRERYHRWRPGDEPQGLPDYHLEYCFPGDEFDHRLIILVAVEKYTKMKEAVVVPNKGSTGRYVVKMVLELIDECGDSHRDVILKTAPGPAIKLLVDDICANRTGARAIVEMSPKASKGPNGVVERAVRSVEECLQAAKSSFDERMNTEVETEHRR